MTAHDGQAGLLRRSSTRSADRPPRRRARFLLIVLLVTVLLPACSDGSTGSVTTAPPSSSSAVPSSSPTSSPSVDADELESWVDAFCQVDYYVQSGLPADKPAATRAAVLAYAAGAQTQLSEGKSEFATLVPPPIAAANAMLRAYLATIDQWSASFAHLKSMTDAAPAKDLSAYATLAALDSLNFSNDAGETIKKAGQADRDLGAAINIATECIPYSSS